ncbi:hypothetical protein EST38_g12012 [Candolleomyces aberdarensis]|uniref:Nephrocystin 3-like N-terminal domain-containing protein n=1 Tax=Candolleomyces aberdarensis TaxID=2316362 RepID=A0A4Q2D504_9AGAR|nr:hypothetical protein EST38_g12012 [Candolleomyces aberdarensis]
MLGMLAMQILEITIVLLTLGLSPITLNPITLNPITLNPITLNPITLNQQLEVSTTLTPSSALSLPRYPMRLTREIGRHHRRIPIASLERGRSWADSHVLFNTDAPHVFWTHGYVGCGKSSISQAVSRRYGRKGRLLASFFFYRNSGDRSKMAKFAVTLASQMAVAVPATKSLIEAAVNAERALLTRRVSLATQLERLVYKPFRTAVKRGLVFKTLLKGPFLVVIDGLDECEDKAEVKAFIEHLLAFFKRYPSTPLRFFITSRVEQHIKECLNADGVQLDDLVAHGSNDDVLTFLETSFCHRVEKDPVLAAYVQSHGQWPTRNDMKTLVHHIGGSFIFASALFKYIVEPSDDGLTPMTRLPLTLNMNPGLDGLYAYTLARSKRLPHFSDVISTIALVFEPLPITGIAKLLGIQTFEVLHILVNLQAIIHIPGTDDLPVTFCHTSLRDFLTTESRSGRFFAPTSHHIHLAFRCFLLKDEQRSATAAASYSNHWEEHLEHFTRLSPNTPGPLPPLDALYAQILAKSQNLPRFSDIISTLALLYEPLPISGIAELLGIGAHEVSEVVDNLRAIIHIPSDKSPVSFCHISLRDFLTTESRSRRFFAPPSHHLRLFYRCLILGDEQRSETAATVYGVGHRLKHFSFSPSSEQEPSTLAASVLPQTLDDFYTHILAKVQHLPHLSDIISTVVFSSGYLDMIPITGPSKFDGWLNERMRISLGWDLGVDFVGKHVYFSKIHQEQAKTLQRDEEQIGKAIREKCCSLLSESPSIPGTDHFTGPEWLPNWTPLDAYKDGQLFQWIVACVQTEMSFAAPGVTCDLVLTIAVRGHYTLDPIYMEISNTLT